MFKIPLCGDVPVSRPPDTQAIAENSADHMGQTEWLLAACRSQSPFCPVVLIISDHSMEYKVKRQMYPIHILRTWGAFEDFWLGPEKHGKTHFILQVFDKIQTSSRASGYLK